MCSLNCGYSLFPVSSRDTHLDSLLCIGAALGLQVRLKSATCQETSGLRLRGFLAILATSIQSQARVLEAYSLVQTKVVSQTETPQLRIGYHRLDSFLSQRTRLHSVVCYSARLPATIACMRRFHSTHATPLAGFHPSLEDAPKHTHRGCLA